MTNKVQMDYQKVLKLGGKTYSYTSLEKLNLKGLPYAIRILLENTIRNQNGFSITEEHIESILDWKNTQGKATIPFMPGRVLMQDFTGVPVVVDLASLRSAVEKRGGNPSQINPIIPVDLVIDHSVQVDRYGTQNAYKENVSLEYSRNEERYSLLKWAQQAFDKFRVIPPGVGICHQVNMEYLARVVLEEKACLFPDTLVGTDSHTPMVNSLGVLGWGVGGIEAEAAMLGQPLYMTLPEVVGLNLVGKLKEGVTATDLVLNITHLLRKHGVVGKFVELTGEGVSQIPVTDRGTISNMSPEFGCTDTHWPVDEETLSYLKKTNRSAEHVDLVKTYTQTNHLWRRPQEEIEYTSVVTLDLSTVESTLAGPKRPQDKVVLKDVKVSVEKILDEDYQRKGKYKSVFLGEGGLRYKLRDAAVVMAAITSCTNTSNPSVMIAAGLLAKKAIALGLRTKPWVKTSLAPGSRVVTRYLKKSGLLPYLEALGFHLVGYGCTTCIGNSGDMPEHIQDAVTKHDLVVAAVLSGNRNFEARIHPHVKMNFLASPPMVVAYALKGCLDRDIAEEALGKDPNGEYVFLKDLWPSFEEIEKVISEVLSEKDYASVYRNAHEGDSFWQELKAPTSDSYMWSDDSTYIQEAPFFKDVGAEPQGSIQDISRARVLLKLGDMVTTDHISPAGKFQIWHPAGEYLVEKGVSPLNFNSYGARRGNHEIMIRGTFANVRIRNQLIDKEGGFTQHFPTNKEMSVFEAASLYQKENIPLIVISGKEYGSGSSRDWAAKGTSLLGVKAVLAESFERIHRSNLVGMGVIPIEFESGQNAETWNLQGQESYFVEDLMPLSPQKKVRIRVIVGPEEKTLSFSGRIRLDSPVEIAYYQHGGILPYIMRHLLKSDQKNT
ncbi:MAG: aconitate hydratase AcnA [Cytophagales bacterium]|nr:aconitate hydratase AcnA [Cytophagales bacterium]